VLDFSRLEAERLELRPEPVDLAALLDRGMRPLRTNAHTKGLTLELSIADPVPRHLVCDPTLLNLVLSNLVGNAVKFTEQGRVELSVHLAGTRNGCAKLAFAVQDTGIGIPADKQALIFEAFSQVDASPSRRHGGSGLGLAIAARVTKLMGGRIEVESAPGQGSRFSFEIDLEYPARPVSEPAPAAAGAPAGAPQQGMRILVAEDNPVNQWVIRHQLDDLGHRVTLAENGQLALDQFSQGQFNLILMDIQMPEMDGYQATAAIRNLERNRGGRIPIVALTAHAHPDDERKCLDAGMDGYLTKPIDVADLELALTRLAGQN
jgi:CheY-like chemotaxis protein